MTRNVELPMVFLAFQGGLGATCGPARPGPARPGLAGERGGGSLGILPVRRRAPEKGGGVLWGGGGL